MAGRITKRRNLEWVTLTPGALLVSPLANRCRSHTGEHKTTRDPHSANRCKPLHRSANTQHKPCAYFLGRTVAKDKRYFGFRFVVSIWYIFRKFVPIPVCGRFGRDKLAAIFLTTFWNAFLLMKMYNFRLRFHWGLSTEVQSTIFHHWFR